MIMKQIGFGISAPHPKCPLLTVSFPHRLGRLKKDVAKMIETNSTVRFPGSGQSRRLFSLTEVEEFSIASSIVTCRGSIETFAKTPTVAGD
jgi:hypothetical protein